MSEETLRLELAAERNEIARLESELREARDALRAARFSPLGDNHHNAAECPYCGDPLRAAQAALSAERTARRVMRKALDAARKVIVGYQTIGPHPVLDQIDAALAAEPGERALRAVAGFDRPWPLADVLDQLAGAAAHLMHDHDCDQHGWELVNQCVERASDYAKQLRALPPEGHPRAAEEKT